MPRWRITFEVDVPAADGSLQRVVEVDEGVACIVGRSKTAAVSIDSGRISREHLAYTVQDGQLFVEDLGSSNGSWLNGQRIMRPTAVKRGDQVHAGRPRIVVVAFEPLAP
jgi:pSer/pThr/pTyr-binding forkhead associated (FHA) protein